MPRPNPAPQQRLSSLLVGVFVLVLAVFTVVSDQQQRACFRDNFADLANVLSYRSVLTQAESEANEKVNTLELDVTTDAEYLAGLEAYRDEMQRIQRERDANPLPPFPAGQCD